MERIYNELLKRFWQRIELIVDDIEFRYKTAGTRNYAVLEVKLSLTSHWTLIRAEVYKDGKKVAYETVSPKRHDFIEKFNAQLERLDAKTMEVYGRHFVQKEEPHRDILPITTLPWNVIRYANRNLYMVASDDHERLEIVKGYIRSRGEVAYGVTRTDLKTDDSTYEVFDLDEDIKSMYEPFVKESSKGYTFYVR